jgi:hypothetical protein
VLFEVKATGEFADLPPGTRIPEPAFDGDLDGYAYVTLEHHLPLVESGKYIVHYEDGQTAEIEINVTKPPTS